MANRVYIPGAPMFRVRDDGNLMAFFTWVDNTTGLEYSNWRLTNGQNGVFVSSPFEKYDHPEKGMQFYNYVRPAYDAKEETKRNAKGIALLAEVQKAAEDMYHSIKGSVPAGAATGRGPTESDDEDTQLPF